MFKVYFFIFKLPGRLGTGFEVSRTEAAARKRFARTVPDAEVVAVLPVSYHLVLIVLLFPWVVTRGKGIR
jgi:hypothetical protein